ncbi:MAG: hypothetical protein HFH73_07805 [Lachnospiraceae bacterium]|jgi:hypothetical protein|nr:hypothetical protein [Lachnospiraceae bacterium]
MLHANLMYLRPGNLFKDFIIERNSQTVTSTGRVPVVYSGDGTDTLKGCLADASDADKAGHSMTEHQVTHTIVQGGAPKAKRADRLVLGERVFYVVDVNDVGALGITTIYYAEERKDMKG